MTPPVKLMDLTDSLDLVSEESAAWLDLKTGRVMIIFDDATRAIEDGEEEDAIEEWGEDYVSAIRAIEAGDKRYLALPDKFEFHEYRHMERFIGTIEDANAADQLWRAIKGKGAFRYFKDTAERLGVIDDWYRFRDDAMKEHMLRWAEVNNVTVDTSRHLN